MDKDIAETVELFFPIKGVSQFTAYNQQPELTSPFMQNVRIKGVAEQRARGGQRAGLKKWATTQVGGAYPIINLTQVVTTYITPG